MEKWQNQRAWFLVMPVVLLVAFNALIPLMTVVNYSVQDIFDSTHRLFVGTEWYRETLLNTRLQNALLRQLVFSGLVLLIELPLGVAIALTSGLSALFGFGPARHLHCRRSRTHASRKATLRSRSSGTRRLPPACSNQGARATTRWARTTSPSGGWRRRLMVRIGSRA